LRTRSQASEGFLKAGGFRGIYRGFGAAALGSALFFSAYEPMKRMLEPQFGPAGVAVSAAFGDTCACLFRVPTEVLKQRMQVGQSATMAEALKDAMRESPLGLYRGFFAMVAREIPFSGIQFPVYEGVRKLTQGDRVSGENSTIGSMGCGAIAGGTAAFLTTPFDFIKTRIILEEGADGARRSAAEIAREAVAKDGFTVLFSGATARTALISVGGCVFFGAYEWSTAFLQRNVSALHK